MNRIQIKKYLFLALEVFTLLSLFYSLTYIAKGGDLKTISCIFTFIISALYILLYRKSKIIRNPVFYAITVYVGASYLLLPFSFAPMVSIKFLNKEILSEYMLFTGLYIILREKHLNSAQTRRFFSFILNIFVVILFIFVFLGLISIALSGENISSRDILNLNLVRFRIHHNVFGMMANFLIAFLIPRILIEDNTLKKLLLIGLLFLSVIVIFLNISRSGWIGFITIIILWNIFIIKEFKKYRIALTSLMLIIFSLSVIYIFLQPSRRGWHKLLNI